MTFFFPIQNPDEGVYAGVVVNEYRVLLVRHKKSDYWFFPHGFSLLSENPDQTVIRICDEQTGLKCYLAEHSPIAEQKGLLKCAVPFHAETRDMDNHKYYCAYYLVRAKDAALPSEYKNGEIEEARWYTKDDLIQLSLPAGIIDICILALEREIGLEF